MVIISTGYSKSKEWSDPVAWLDHISFYTGILEELARQHEVYSIERINFEGQVIQNNVTYIFLDLGKPGLVFPARMHNLIKSKNPNLILVNGFIFPLQLIQLRMSVGKSATIFVLNRAEKPGRGIMKFLQQMSANMVNAFLFASNDQGMDWVLTGIIKDSKKIKTIVQASSSFKLLNKEQTELKPGISARPVFLWVGRLNENKDPVTVIKAFTAFQKSSKHGMLYMIYQSEELLQEVNQLIEEKNAQETIILIGKTPHHELENWYNAADFIISGSHSEGSGIAIIEAMSCGCIPIVTSIPSFKEITAMGSYGFLYEAGNDKNLLEVLNNLDFTNISILRKKIHDRFIQEFSFRAISQKILTAYTGTSL